MSKLSSAEKGELLLLIMALISRYGDDFFETLREIRGEDFAPQIKECPHLRSYCQLDYSYCEDSDYCYYKEIRK